MNLKAEISETVSRLLSTDSSDKGVSRIAKALDAWADNLTDDGEHVVKLLVNDNDGLLELVLTTLSRIADNVRQELLNPMSPILREATYGQVLGHLNVFFSSLPTFVRRPEGLSRHQVQLEKTLAAADAVKKIKFMDKAQPKDKSKKRVSKHSKAPSQAEIDEKTFDNVDCRVPETVEQAGKLAATLNARLHTILRAYIEALRHPDVAKHVRTRHLSSSSDSSDASKGAEAASHGVLHGSRLHLDGLAQEGQLPYMDGLELGCWPVIFSHRVFRRLCQISCEDAKTFGIAIRKISELSQGLFSDANHVQLYDHGVPIFKAFLFGDQRLIYQIDFGAPVEHASGHKLESQYLRFFDICSVARIRDRFWSDIARQLGRRSQLYKQRCKARQVGHTQGTGETPPMTFERGSMVELFEDNNPESLELDEKHFLELHRILATEKFIKLSHETVNIIISDEKQKEDLDLVFAPSSQEHDVIHHKSSSLVLGRGGTGKTTTMLMKMLQLEQSARNLGRPLRQVFITQSASLVNKVESYYEKLVYSSSGGFGAKNTKKDAPPPEFSLRSMDQDLIKDKFPPGTRFGDLDNSKFPLFLTFNELFKLLERDFEPVHNDEERLMEYRHPVRPLSYKDGYASFEYFRAEIWPRLGAWKGLHPALVFNEFMGVIKGSEQALNCSMGYLDRETYENLSSRMYPTFASDRARIYTLFEAYRKLKSSQMLDAPDRTHSLIKKLCATSFKPQLDFLYVDEMQDNLLIDASVLSLICRNPHGLFYAGDTAQTISVGSAFRFKDLKQFLYQRERKEPLVIAGKRRPVDPEFFELTVNYRSHGGIVDVAAFLVSLINRAFPNAIDMLQREQALVYGPKPVFFMGRMDDGSFTRLLSCENSDDAIELGAGQVIIVRNGQARAALREEIGDSPLIMTLYETKGLEFNDVILYNFFAHSMASPADWRALLALFQDSPPSSSPTEYFQDDMHRILQLELKSLYVAFTRAREHVWVWDQSENGQSLGMLLAHRHLVDLRGPHTVVPQIAVKSSEQDWAKQGQELFAKRLYAEASTSFRKGKLPWLQNVAQIYADRETARKLPSASARRPTLLKEIADAFSKVAVEARNVNDAKDLYAQAANCYADAADNARAAAMFFLACMYTDSVWHYRLAGQLDEAMNIIAKHGDNVDEDVKSAVTYLAKVAYTKKSETKKALSLFRGKTQEYVEFLHDHGFEKQSVVVLEEETAYDQAAEVCIANGEYRKAVDLLLRCKTEAAMRRAASVLLNALRKELPFGATRQTSNAKVEELMELIQKIDLQIDEHQEVALFRALYCGRPADLFDDSHHYIHSGKFVTWDLLAFDGFLRDKSPLIEDQASMASLCGILQIFIDYGRRVRNIARLHDIVSEQELRPLFGISLQASTQLSPGSESDSVLDDVTSVRILPGSLIYNDALHAPSNPTVAQNSEQTGIGIMLPRHIVNDLVRERLLAQFNGMLSDLQDRLKGLERLQVCLRFASTGRCDPPPDRRPCGKWHSDTRHKTIDAFNERIRVHLLVITALDHFTAIERREPAAEGPDPNREEERSRKFFQRYWLARLFHVCYPVVLNLGNLTHIVPDVIPDFNALMTVVRQWIEEVLRAQSPGTPSPHMLSDMLTTSMLAAYFDYHNARSYAHRSYLNLGTFCRRARDVRYFRAIAIQNAMMYLFRGAPNQRNTAINHIKSVIERRMAVDINVMMGFIEDVCMQAAYIQSFPGEGRPGRLLLPRSWMIRVLRRADPTRHDRTMMEELITTLGALVVILSTGNCGQLYPNAKIASPRRRNLQILRSCRLMAILGYNLGDAKLQFGVVQSLKTLKQAVITSLKIAFPGILQEANIVERSSGLIRPFILCTTWTDVMRALQSSMRFRGSDELILAYHQPINTAILPSVRCINYFDAGDLHRQLTAGPQVLFLSTTSWNNTAPPSKHSISVKALADLPVAATIESNPEQIDKTPALEADVDHHGYTEKEIEAVSLIQRSFVKYRKRTSGGKAGPTWDAFHERSKELRGRGIGLDQHSIYHIFLQGPLPRVMAVLSVLRDTCQRSKKAVDKAMRTSRSDVVEDSILDRRLRVLTVLKEVTSLTSAICPTSALHEEGAAEKIISEVKKVPKICARVTEVAKEGGWEATDDYHLGVNAILITSAVKVKRTKVKAKRPELNTEDLDDWY